MNRLGIVFFLMLVMLVRQTPLGVQARTSEELKGIIVSAADLGDGWSIQSEGPLEIEADSFRRQLVLQRAPGQLATVILVDGGYYNNLNPSVVTPLFVQGVVDTVTRGGSLTATLGPKPEFAESAVRHELSGTAMGRPVTGELVGWYQHGVIAVVLVLTSGRADAMPLVDQQMAKLSTTLGPLPRPQVAPLLGQVDCSAFASREAAQALLESWPGDPYGLDPDGNGLACELLPSRSGGAPDRTPLLQRTGTGDTQTDSFTTRGRVEVCWELSSTSDSGQRPAASFFVTPLRGVQVSPVSLTAKTENGCSFANLAPGPHYVKVTSTSWTAWTVTVRPAP